jgi:DNA recombination protein RmuC
LLVDVVRLSDRVSSLDRHFDQASRDIEQIKTSAGKIESRSGKIESLDLDDPDEIEGSEPEALPGS